MTIYTPSDKVPLPPSDAKMVTTVCDYCIVGCGYNVYTWPVGQEGGPRAGENALGVDFPSSTMGAWISPNQHNIVQVNGQPHHVVVVADIKSKVVNVGGNHSIRGGTLALKCYNADGPTSDRLKQPMLRVNGKLTPVDWDTALDIMAAVSQHVIAKYGESAWAMKAYSYQYFENTYAISKLAFESIQTPAFATHDKPGPGADTAGVDWSGINPFSASYDDWGSADVLFISGSDPYETKTVLFTSWIMKVPKIIMVLPRKTTGTAYAEARGGLMLQIIPGTDSLLHMAMSRYILEQGWEDKEWLKTHISNKWEINSGMGRGTRNTPWQWATTWSKLGAVDFDGYKEWLLASKYAELSTAAEITDIPVEKIKQAAEMLAKPVGGQRPKASFAFEKGNYWSQNWVNTSSFAALGLLCGAGNRPGKVISRLGGHQRGWMGALNYPRSASPNKLPGRRRQEIDLDRWVESGHVRFAWVIGNTWTGGMAASQELARSFHQATRGNRHQIASTSKQAVIDTLIQRVDSGGMVVVYQNIYLGLTMGTEIADIVLPAATWGEEDFTRANGERRLRLYSKFYDPPGEAKPDWWIISRFATKMGFKGYDWKNSNQVFEEAARFGRKGTLNYHPLVWLAKKKKMPAHELLRQLGTHGIQTPIRFYSKIPPHDTAYMEYAGFYNDPSLGVLVGTKRLHDESLELMDPQGPTIHMKWLTQFDTQVGKAVFLKSPWEEVEDFYHRVRPDPAKGELWVTNGRINEIWQSGFDDIRKLYLKQRWPDVFVEIHPEDAEVRGIENGDLVRVWNDDVLIQTGGFVLTGSKDYTFSELVKKGLIRVGKGETKAVAIVTDAVHPGVMYHYFLWPEQPANSLVPRVPSPFIPRYRFKLGKGKVEKIGESPFKNSFEQMSFKPRTVM